MRQNSMKFFYIALVLMVGVVALGFPSTSSAAKTSINEEFDVSTGVKYKDYRLSSPSIDQAIRVMEVNMNDQYTNVEVGIPSALNRLEKTTSQALSHHRDGHKVVGAINGSFFHLGTAMNLIAKDNRLVHAGEVFEGKDKYVNEPIAFGLKENGQALIDDYQIDLNYVHNDRSYTITSTNKARTEDSIILYTAKFPSNYTNTNSYGSEVVVTLPSAPTLEFGSTVEGNVVEVRKPDESTKTAIPENGFVLSGHGDGSETLSNIKVGDSIKLSVDVDQKWKNSSFMLASGPMLVKDGRVSMTMDPNSLNARMRAPRTAVAIDSTGEKVYFITVDGRQSGYSDGMSLKGFAEYLVRLGVDRALNLDGGGSTAMAVRSPGMDKVSLYNSPSDGFERKVSTTLMAISTAPDVILKDVDDTFWAASAIESLVEKGTISGYPDGTFKPDRSISRSHAALMLTRDLGLDTSNVTDPGFKDVRPTDKYYKEIAAAANAGLVRGRSDGEFVTDANLTRAEMAVILQRGYNIQLSNKNHFADVTKSHFAYQYINGLAESGIANGYPDGTYKPDDSVTRAEFSAFLFNTSK